MKEERKRIAISVSLAPRAYELIERAENKSRFIENSVLSMNALDRLIQNLKNKKMPLESTMKEIEDLVDSWKSEFDETEDFDFRT